MPIDRLRGGQRWRHKHNAAGAIFTHVSLGGLVEKVTNGSVTDWRHLIEAEGRTVALYSRKSSGTNTLRYLLHDHLGSVDAITTSGGAVELKESFEAFGGRRGSAWSGVPSSAQLATMREVTRRGYTGHWTWSRWQRQLRPAPEHTGSRSRRSVANRI